MSLHQCISDVETQGFSVELVEDHYRAWVKIPFYVVIDKFNEEKVDYEYRVFRSAKRGDEKYADRQLSRFRRLRKIVPLESYFRWGETDRGQISSPCVFVTLTYAPKEIELKDAYGSVGHDFNRWISGLRSAHGPIDVVRVWESQKNGYPHVHCALHFRDVSWKGFHHYTWKKGKKCLEYRVDEVDAFKANWHGGFVDVLLLNSSRAGYSYCSKYLSKSVRFKGNDVKGQRTLALCWYFRKRSFAISGQLRSLYGDLISTESNSNFHGVSSANQTWKWELFGFVRGFGSWGYGLTPISRAEIQSLRDQNLLVLRDLGPRGCLVG